MKITLFFIYNICPIQVILFQRKQEAGDDFGVLVLKHPAKAKVL